MWHSGKSILLILKYILNPVNFSFLPSFIWHLYINGDKWNRYRQSRCCIFRYTSSHVCVWLGSKSRMCLFSSQLFVLLFTSPRLWVAVSALLIIRGVFWHASCKSVSVMAALSCLKCSIFFENVREAVKMLRWYLIIFTSALLPLPQRSCFYHYYYCCFDLKKKKKKRSELLWC